MTDFIWLLKLLEGDIKVYRLDEVKIYIGDSYGINLDYINTAKEKNTTQSKKSQKNYLINPSFSSSRGVG